MIEKDKYGVFISHGSADTWIARQIARCIKDCDAATFLDEADISKGDNFKEVIHKELGKSKELVALFTPWSVKRFWVWVEIGAAWGQGQRIIVVLHGLTQSELEELGGSKAILEDINILELNNFDRYIDELKERVKKEQNA